MCPLCNVPVTMKHLIWQCSYHDGLPPLPQEWVNDLEANEDQMLWTRGFIEEPAFNPTVGLESHEVMRMFDQGWPVLVRPGSELSWLSMQLVEILV